MVNAVCACRSLRNRAHRILTHSEARQQENRSYTMDTKAKKRHEVIKKKLEQLRPRLAGAKQQADDPSEAADLQKEIDALEAEMAKLKEN